jgi:hypothetical protein
MIRPFRSLLCSLFAASLAVSCVVSLPATAQDAAGSKVTDKTKAKAKSQTKTAKNTAKTADTKSDEAGKPVQVASFGDWGAFMAQQGGKKKTCYALAQPKERMPASLKRDAAYIFISSRPAENVHNEISIIMGFTMKDNGEAQADIGGTHFQLIAKGTNAWIKNPAEEAQFIETMKKGSKLVIKAASTKGNTTTDSYSLAGLSQALERVQKECP